MSKPDWPVLTSYTGPHLRNIAMPLGGMGAGSVSIGGSGDLRDFELFNKPSKGFVPSSLDIAPCVMMHISKAGSGSELRLIEGPVDSADYQGSVGCRRPNHGIPRFRECRFDAAYPLAQVHLTDDDVPVSVTMQAFSPVIPADADSSSQPVIQLRYVLHNHSSDPVQVATIATLPNFIGMDPKSRELLGNGRVRYSGPNNNRIEVRQSEQVQGLYFFSNDVDRGSQNFGSVALATAAAEQTSARTCWLDNKYYSALLDFRNDLDADGRLSDREQVTTDVPTGSLAVHCDLQPGESRSVTFFLTWHFPNRMDWTSGKHDELVGNWYTAQYTDAWNAMEQLVPRMPALEATTVKFVRALCESDVPAAIKEAMLCNLSTLFTETCQRLPDGTFCSFEGCGDQQGYCEGSCTHVWNYEQALAFLWGELSLGMREVEFELATGERGDMAFRVMQPFATRARDFGKVAADGQMGCIMKMYRDWTLSGDTARLRRLWPRVRKALEYCWIVGGWDADQDGLMEGCQHNTMDVEYYGPNPQMQFWYLGALRAGAKMAAAIGDESFSERCGQLFHAGSTATDEVLFNGDYYEHKYIEPAIPGAIPAEQILFPDKPADRSHQLLDGCLIDQCVGQLMSHVCGLGYLGDPRNIRKALSSVAKWNQQDGFHGHFNVMRTFALGDEKALLMAAYPKGPRGEFPFPYFSEVMSGFEYSAAAGMIFEGLREQGLSCIRNIRDRYDGRKRNPFDEAECGHHYVRALASWAAGLAWTGFHYSAITAELRVNGEDGCWFWSNGYAWGQYRITGTSFQLSVLHGELLISEVVVRGRGQRRVDTGPVKLSAGTEPLRLDIVADHVRP
ncbi:GH116 family glycosyl-hydrolase [Woeseia oceani]|uniref:Glycosyl-hydrolase family 116 catalytic region domain-containing protein n=1 Tax=Woeseia oceani TaxID=1548547 RepID=A0A193LDQ7_9GAMM|nr:GH116 family glycosyl-hydrolase [Woeseia oceani]ANO50576.1 hypothetical protein BA177_04520 [Woeseia oceani]